MDCRSCGVVNAPGRRYCRECGARLGQPCVVCHFFNATEDKHCGGCGRRLKGGALAEAQLGGVCSEVRGLEDVGGFDDFGRAEPAVALAADAGGGQGVSQTEIDGLFENILDDDSEEPAGEDA